MKLGVLGAALLLLATGAPASGQDACPPPAPVRLIANVTPVLGQGPLWVAAGGKPLKWKGPNTPIKLLWIRDVTARGPAWITGKARTGTGKTTFSRALYGLPVDKLPLDELGEKVDGIKEADLKKYAFYWAFIYFPGPGCYEVAGRVGRQQTSIILTVVPETS